MLTPHPTRKGGGKQVTDGRQCQANGNGLEGGVAGVASVIVVQCRDSEGNKRTTGGDVVLVAIHPEGGPSADAHVIDNVDGTYTCSYLPKVAHPYCKVTVTVNGTRIMGSPFSAKVTPGPTNAMACKTYGHGLRDGIAGQECSFTVATHDLFGNRCSQAGDKFKVVVKPIQSLLPELQTFLRKYEVPSRIEDNEDGTHGVFFTADYAGFYAVDVTLASIPVGDSPCTVCICNPTIGYPKQLSFESLGGKENLAPPSGDAAPPANDYVLIMNTILALKSESIERTGGRPTREYVHSYRLQSAMSRDNEKWRKAMIRSQLPKILPPPYRRQCVGLDVQLLALCHADTDGSPSCVSEARTLNLADVEKQEVLSGWEVLQLDGKAPNAVSGYACASWDGRRSVLICGGVDGTGKVTNDIFMLSLGGVGTSSATWRTLAEWPSSIFSGEGFSERCHHSLTHQPGTSSFWIYGGRGADDLLVDGLHVFDMEAEQWTTPQSLNDPPPTREHHAACFVAERYLVIHGGLDETGKVLDTVAVYDTMTATWQTIADVPPRAHHRLFNNGGVMYCAGGIDEKMAPAASVPLRSDTYVYPQAACFDFVGNNAQAILVKPVPSIQALRQVFSIECTIYPRSFSQYTPIVVKCDNGFKSGFGLIGQEHPAYKGDAEEGAWLHFFVGLFTPSGGGNQAVMTKIELNEWIHVACTYDGADIRIYVNGQLKHFIDWAMTEEEAETLHTKGDLMIGGMPGKYAYDGLVDDVRLWDICVPEAQIKERMNTPYTNPITDHLLGQWTFNEGAGDMILDSSGSRNHAVFDKYAGGVELRRVQSTRPKIELVLNEREKHIDANFQKLQDWKNDFFARNGRPPAKADLVFAEPEISALARRLGEFGID